MVAGVALLLAGVLSVRTGGALFPLSLGAVVAIVVWLREPPVAAPPRGGVLGVFGALVAVTAVADHSLGVAVVMVAGVVAVLVGALVVRSPRAAAVLLLMGVIWIGAGGDLASQPNDVVAAHEAATARVLDGDSPYRDLGVVESNPSNYGAAIDGYSYPPVALGVYGLLGRVVGGPGIVTVVLWVVIVGWAMRRYGVESLAAPALALVPGLALSAEYTWTEPLTALLVLGALVVGAGDRRAGLLGVAFASKQYLALALPALVVAWWRRRRWLVVAAVAAAVVSLPLLLDVGGAFDALVGFHLDRPVRTDSTNLAGYLAATRGWTSWPVPSWVVAGVAGGGGAWIARAHGELGWLAGMVGALAITLAIGPVSLVNYWILVTVLLLLVVGERGRAHR